MARVLVTLATVAGAPGCRIGFDPAGGGGATADATTEAPDAAPCLGGQAEQRGDGSCSDGVDNDCDGQLDHDDDACPRLMVRSVGVATGALTPLTLTATVTGEYATFASPLPDRVGIGDVVVFGSSNTLALGFVRARVSATKLRLVDRDGADLVLERPPGTAAAIYRAYDEMGRLETLVENPALPDEVRDFERDRDLVGRDAALAVACYADGIVTNTVTLSGWNTSPDHYLRIYTPVGPAEVGVSQRHDGTFAGGFQMEAGDNFPTLQLVQSHVRIEGLALRGWPGAGPGISTLEVDADDADIDVRISHNILDGNGSVNSNGILHLAALGAGATGTFRSSNNIAYDSPDDTSECMWHRNEGGATARYFIHNNTVWGCGRGIEARDTAGRAFAVNNLAFVTGAGPAFFPYGGAGEFASTSSHNVSGDTSAAVIGASALTGVDPSQVFRSVVPATLDLRLGPDAPVVGAGKDLVLDPDLAVIDDIEGQARAPGSNDPGADER